MRSFITSLVVMQVIFASLWAASAFPLKHLDRRKPQSSSSLLSGIPIVGALLGNVPNTAGGPNAGSALSGVPMLGGSHSGLPSVGSNGGVIPPNIPDTTNSAKRGLDNPSRNHPESLEVTQSHFLDTQLGEYASLPATIVKVTDSLKAVCDELKQVISTKGPTRPDELIPSLTKIKVILTGATSDINLGIVDNASDDLLLYEGKVFTVQAIAGLVTELFSLLIMIMGTVKHVALSSGLRVKVVLHLISDIDGLLAELLALLFSLVPGLLDAFCPNIEYLYPSLFKSHFVAIIKILGIRG